MGDEWVEFLVLVGVFGEVVLVFVVVGYYCYVLQVVVIVFFVYWVVVWVVGYQLFDDVGVELFGFFVFDGDLGVVGGGGYVGYDEVIMFVVFVGVLFYCVLVVGVDVIECWVLVEVGNVEIEGQIGLQEVVCIIDFECFVVYVDSGYGLSFCWFVVSGCG